MPRYNLGHPFVEGISDQLDKLVHAVDRRVAAEIDAGACQTQSDYRKRDKMMDEECQTREEVEKELYALIERALDLYKVGIVAPLDKKKEEVKA
jgi:hypothetical protein